jgi:predicted phosphodiesterase
MRLAVLADIHGNRHALAGVLADLERRPVDRVVVAGDLINRGPANADVLETVVAMGWDAIAGNHERLVAQWLNGAAPSEWHTDPWYAPLGWVAGQVADWSGYLSALVHELRIDGPNAQPIRVLHASARSDRDGIRPSMSDEQIAALLEGVDEPLVVCGHTHVPLDRMLEAGRRGRVVNVGSVGVPFDGDVGAQYARFTLLADGTWQVEQCTVDYDRAAALAEFDASPFLASGLAARIFRYEFSTARSHLYSFEQWARATGAAVDGACWERFVASR